MKVTTREKKKCYLVTVHIMNGKFDYLHQINITYSLSEWKQSVKKKKTTLYNTTSTGQSEYL